MILQKLLVVLNYLDWITPTLAVGRTAFRRRPYILRIPWMELSMTDRDIIELLRQHGIDAWASILTLNDLLIAVRPEDAPRAQHVLLQHQVPLRFLMPGIETPVTKF